MKKNRDGNDFAPPLYNVPLLLHFTECVVGGDFLVMRRHSLPLATLPKTSAFGVQRYRLLAALSVCCLGKDKTDSYMF